jgi:hypothetical protein
MQILFLGFIYFPKLKKVYSLYSRKVTTDISDLRCSYSVILDDRCLLTFRNNMAPLSCRSVNVETAYSPVTSATMCLNPGNRGLFLHLGGYLKYFKNYAYSQNSDFSHCVFSLQLYFYTSLRISINETSLLKK